MNLTFIIEEFPDELFLVDMRSIPDMGISNFDFLLCTTTGLTYCALQHKLILDNDKTGFVKLKNNVLTKP